MTEQFELAILPGTNKCGEKEGFDKIVIHPGDTISIVGATGSGKSTFINDIEVLAQADTVTGRTILMNGVSPSDDIVRDPSKKPIVIITQNTRVLADFTVSRFLALHIKARGRANERELIASTIELTNQFTGEGINETMRMTSLSGGQTRALLIADAIIVGQTPILLMDEVENVGIFKERVIACLKRYEKALILVTHDPLVALITDRRIVMKHGAVVNVLTPADREFKAVSRISDMDACFREVRERIRAGEIIEEI